MHEYLYYWPQARHRQHQPTVLRQNAKMKRSFTLRTLPHMKWLFKKGNIWPPKYLRVNLHLNE